MTLKEFQLHDSTYRWLIFLCIVVACLFIVALLLYESPILVGV